MCQGGGCHFEESNVFITNSSFLNNAAHSGGGMFVSGAPPGDVSISTCILILNAVDFTLLRIKLYITLTFGSIYDALSSIRQQHDTFWRISIHEWQYCIFPGLGLFFYVLPSFSMSHYLPFFTPLFTSLCFL